MRQFATRLASILVLGFAPLASAGSNNADLNVSASVADSCLISTTPLAFGTYDTIGGAELDSSSGKVTITCTQGAVATVTLGQGENADTNSSDDAPLRRLKSGSNYLSYSLFQDAQHQNVWGNTSETGQGHTASDNHAFDMTVFGAVLEGQSVPRGTYQDTVIATVSF